MVMNRVSIAVLALVWSGCSEAPSSERQQIAQSTEALSSQAGSSINNPIAFATTMPYANCQTHPAGQSTPRGQIVRRLGRRPIPRSAGRYMGLRSGS